MKAKRLLRNTSVALIILLIVLGVARAIAPSLITKYANQQLDNTKGVRGHIGDVDLALYRGAYKIKNLTLYLQDNNENAPTVTIEMIDFSVLWSALLRGEIVAEVHVYNGNYEFVDTEKQQDDLTEEAKSKETWLELYTLASPISIDKIVLHNNKLTLTTRSNGTVQKNFIDAVDGEIINLTNSREFTGSKIAKFTLDGKIMSKATAVLSGSLNPDTAKPTFDINFEMQKLPVDELAGIIDFYAPLDVEQGEIDAAMEIIANNGEVDGYVKAGIYNTQVFTWKGDIEEDDDSIFTGLFEGLIDGFASIFESGKSNLIAVNVPVSGTIDNTEVSTFDAIVSLFHNAFVNAYEIKVDDTFNLDEPVKPES